MRRGRAPARVEPAGPSDTADSTSGIIRRIMSDPLRAHLERILNWDEAHVDFDNAVNGIPADLRGPWLRVSSTRPGN